MMRITGQGSGRRMGVALASTLAMCTAMLGGASTASAQVGGVGGAALPQFPSFVAIGDQDVPVSLLIENRSTGIYAPDSFQFSAADFVGGPWPVKTR